MASDPWDAIVTSPLKRARRTAENIGQQVKPAAFYEMDALRERNYGAASGMTNEEVAIRYPDGDVPCREERADLTRRSMDSLKRIVLHHTGQKIIVVSHGAVINAFLAEVSNGTIGSGKTVLKNACLSRLVHEDETWEIVVYNSTEHLDHV